MRRTPNTATTAIKAFSVPAKNNAELIITKQVRYLYTLHAKEKKNKKKKQSKYNTKLISLPQE